MHLHRTLTQDPKYLLRINRTDDQLLADSYVSAVFNQQARPLRNWVSDFFGTIVGNDDELASLVSIVNANSTSDLADRGNTLGGASLEQLDDARQTVRNVFTCDTSRVEGAHC